MIHFLGLEILLQLVVSLILLFSLQTIPQYSIFVTTGIIISIAVVYLVSLRLVIARLKKL